MDGSTLRVVVAVLIMAVAALVAEVVRRRRRTDPPTQPRHQVPRQLDRSDFDASTGAAEGRPEWLVVVFTSDTCSTCADVARKAEVLRSPSVEVAAASFQARPDLHRRYRIEAVPCVLVADAAGVVVDHVVGPVSATDLWALVAEARSPGSVHDGGACG